MRAKLGLLEQHAGDIELLNSLLSVLARTGTDYTYFFRTLADFDPKHKEWDLFDSIAFSSLLQNWLVSYRNRLTLERASPAERRERMNRVNPCYVLRGRLLDRAVLNADQGDFAELDRLMTLLQNPYEERAGMEQYSRPQPEDMPPALMKVL